MTKPAPKRRRDPMSLYAFRLPDALMAEVDRVAQKLEAEQPGMSVTRAQAVRVLLREAIRARKAPNSA
jgi:metal-responsive CopG/Arc/MetJ family transcriptional regulator